MTKPIPAHAILTTSGRYVDVTAPRVEDIDIEDIATALSRIARFGGHGKRFYSVAEHSVLVALLAPREHGLAALLHDAAEAYIGDLVYPLKSHERMHAFRHLDDALQDVIFKRFGCQILFEKERDLRDAAIKRCDLIMLGVEQRVVMGNSDDWPVLRPVRDDVDLAMEDARVEPKFRSPDEARKFFLRAFYFYANGGFASGGIVSRKKLGLMGEVPIVDVWPLKGVER